jgi:penicillin-binding protein 2
VHGTAGAWKLRDHAWFVAFAPYDDPRYAISVLVEHGGFGASAAAPKAREIMRTVLLKDAEVMKRVQTVTPMPPAPDEAPAATPPDPGAKV